LFAGPLLWAFTKLVSSSRTQAVGRERFILRRDVKPSRGDREDTLVPAD
jgi:hypothetical protein